jgi:hypothetical protein
MSDLAVHDGAIWLFTMGEIRIYLLPPQPTPDTLTASVCFLLSWVSSWRPQRAWLRR